MNKYLKALSVAAIVSLFSTFSLAYGNYSPVGSWKVSTGESRYKIYSCGDKGDICVTLIWLNNASRTPENLKLLGHNVVKHAKPNGPNSWSGIISLNGNKYSGTMTMTGENSMILKGCVSFICQTYYFNRL